ncbi:MAG: LURP-one-related family protein [Acidimicrobiales bacterium]|nr:LURP-one-related family protein [Acidimicrobiales bacterium]
MGLRDRRGGGGGGHHRFQMRTKVMSIGDDSWIEDENGSRIYKANGKALHLRKKFILEDANGNDLAEIQERVLSVRDKMVIERDSGSATVHKALIGIRERYQIDVDGGPDLKAHGNFVDHEYEIERDGDTVATVSKRWFRVRDTYGIEIADGEDDVLLLAVAVCIDAMAHD